MTKAAALSPIYVWFIEKFVMLNIRKHYLELNPECLKQPSHLNLPQVGRDT